MDPKQVVLLDADPRLGMGERLSRLLDQEPFRYSLQPTSFFESATLPWDSGPGADRFPDLIFLLSFSRHLEACGTHLQRIRSLPIRIPVIAICEDLPPLSLRRLFQMGLDDFVATPLRDDEARLRISKVFDPAAAPLPGAREAVAHKQMARFIGRSPIFLQEIQKIPLFGRCPSTVLILGETGTGKELCARAIHYLSPRAGKPFIPVNCGAIPAELIENELFGHDRGAYTHAQSERSGLIEAAHEGTLFLDEVDSMPIVSQVKLLRFLEDKEFRRLGSSQTRNADIRIIAASNRNLEERVEQGLFRQDLFYRLNVLTLTLPPLKSRKEDVLVLLNHFLEEFCGKFEKGSLKFTPAALHRLLAYPWPGNVRELKNIIERAVVLAQDNVIGMDCVGLPLRNQVSEPSAAGFAQAKARAVQSFESNYLREILLAHRGNVSRAAHAAGKDRRAFFELMKKHGIAREDIVRVLEGAVGGG